MNKLYRFFRTRPLLALFLTTVVTICCINGAISLQSRRYKADLENNSESEWVIDGDTAVLKPVSTQKSDVRPVSLKSEVPSANLTEQKTESNTEETASDSTPSFFFDDTDADLAKDDSAEPADAPLSLAVSKDPLAPVESPEPTEEFKWEFTDTNPVDEVKPEISYASQKPETMVADLFSDEVAEAAEPELDLNGAQKSDLPEQKEETASSLSIEEAEEPELSTEEFFAAAEAVLNESEQVSEELAETLSESETPAEEAEDIEIAGAEETAEPAEEAEEVTAEENAPAEAAEVAEAEAPADNAEVAEAEAPADNAEVAEAEAPADNAEVAEAEAPADNAEVAEADVPADNAEVAEAEVPADNAEVAEAEAPADNAEVAEADVPADNAEVAEAEAPADNAEVAEAEAPADNAEVAEAEAPADNAEVAEAEVPADNAESEENIDKDGLSWEPGKSDNLAAAAEETPADAVSLPSLRGLQNPVCVKSAQPIVNEEIVYTKPQVEPQPEPQAATQPEPKTDAPAAVAAPAVRGSEVWAVSTENINGFVANPNALTCWKSEKGQFRASSLDEYKTTLDVNMPTIILIHGNMTDWSGALTHAQTLKQRIDQLRARQQIRTPYRLVIWKWASERQNQRIRPDSQAKAYLADINGFYLATFLNAVNSNGGDVTMFGFSFGARTIGSALELLAGGNVLGHSLPAGMRYVSGDRYHAVLLAGACNYGDFNVTGQYAHGSLLLSSLINVFNPSDNALHFYPLLYGAGGPQAIGVAPVDSKTVSASFQRRLWSIDSSGYGPQHSFNNLLYSICDPLLGNVVFAGKVWSGVDSIPNVSEAVVDEEVAKASAEEEAEEEVSLATAE